jgi:hypothetical protein
MLSIESKQKKPNQGAIIFFFKQITEIKSATEFIAGARQIFQKKLFFLFL